MVAGVRFEPTTSAAPSQFCDLGSHDSGPRASIGTPFRRAFRKAIAEPNWQYSSGVDECVGDNALVDDLPIESDVARL